MKSLENLLQTTGLVALYIQILSASGSNSRQIMADEKAPQHAADITIKVESNLRAYVLLNWLEQKPIQSRNTVTGLS